MIIESVRARMPVAGPTRWRRYFPGMRSLYILAAVALVSCGGPTFNGVALEPPEPAAPLSLTDSAGSRFDLAAQRGKVVLLFFGYTHCPDVCPTVLSDWRKVADSLGTRADAVRFVFVSVDPERDLPAPVQRYAARFSPRFLGLSGSRAQIDSILSAWKLAAVRETPGTDTTTAYTVSHPSHVYVIDRQGRLALLHRPDLTPAQVAADIRALQ